MFHSAACEFECAWPRHSRDARGDPLLAVKRVRIVGQDDQRTLRVGVDVGGDFAARERFVVVSHEIRDDLFARRGLVDRVVFERINADRHTVRVYGAVRNRRAGRDAPAELSPTTAPNHRVISIRTHTPSSSARSWNVSIV